MDDDIRAQLERRHYAEAFDLLLQQFKDRVFRLAFSLLRNQTQAEDAAQDTFVKIWKGLPNFHGDASLSTWIYTITRNTCLSELKKRAARPTLSLQDPEMEETADRMTAAPSNSAQPGSEMDLDAMLEALPEKPRRVVILFYLEQKSYEEVAAMLGIPLGTVKTLLFRAKKELLKIGARHERLSITSPSRSDLNPTSDPACSARHTGAAWHAVITLI